MPKIRAVGLMEWPVANTKVKRKKMTNKRKKALKMSFFKILKNAFEFFFILSQGPTRPKIRIPR